MDSYLVRIESLLTWNNTYKISTSANIITIFSVFGNLHDLWDYLCYMFRFGSTLDQLDHDQKGSFVYSAFEEVTDLVSLIKGVS